MDAIDLPRHKSKAPSQADDDKKQPPVAPDLLLTKRETRKLMANASLAALLIGLVFVLVLGLFILFSVTVWLR